jgi:O-antigen/teichoic acid export membrane protein
MLKKFWDSPTITTWLSYSTKTISIFFVLPLILKKFTPNDIVLWYLFFTIVSLQSLADFGFRQTFSRVISYAFGGASDIGVFSATKKTDNKPINSSPNIALLNGIVSNMKYIYLWLTLALFILMGIFGTWAMMKPINESSNVYEGWCSWIIVFVVTTINFYGKLYMNFLEGLFKIAIVRRIETLTSLGTIFCMIIVMIWAPTVLNMIIVSQFWVLVVTFRDWYLCKTVDNNFYESVSKKLPFNKPLFLQIWKPAWKSGVSGLMSVGLTNLSGVIYAQVGSSASVAAYLLTLRIISQIREISMAPFYSTIPIMSILRVKNDLPGLRKHVTKSMFLSHITYVTGFVVAGLLMNKILHMIHSEVKFVDPLLWILIGIAFFIHRFGAMHVQVQMSTNHIVSHIADGISGILYIISSVILSRYIGVYAIPVGMLVGYLGFYAWYAARYSYRSLDTTFFKFEPRASFIPVSILIIYVLVTYTI